MIKQLKKNKKNWFTLVEVIIVWVVFAFIVVWIIWAINRSYMFMNNIKYQVIATNLAREWVEMMFNIRDTNWKKYSWKKDESWASFYKLGCPMYAIGESSTWLYTTALSVPLLGCNNVPANIWRDVYDGSLFFNEQTNNNRNIQMFKVNLSWNYQYISGSINDDWDIDRTNSTWSISDLLWNEIDFYRLVSIYGVYDKNKNDPDFRVTNLTDETPKELRFCVKVFYKTDKPHSSELCSVMTNFEE